MKFFEEGSCLKNGIWQTINRDKYRESDSSAERNKRRRKGKSKANYIGAC